jgi:gas vesicle protein
MRNRYGRNDDYEMQAAAMNMATFVAGLVVGSLAGAVVMVFIAPQSGRDTRRQLAEKSMELRDRVMETAEEARLRAGEVAAQARDKAQQVTDDARARLSNR